MASPSNYVVPQAAQQMTPNQQSPPVQQIVAQPQMSPHYSQQYPYSGQMGAQMQGMSAQAPLAQVPQAQAVPQPLPQAVQGQMVAQHGMVQHPMGMGQEYFNGQYGFANQNYDMSQQYMQYCDNPKAKEEYFSQNQYYQNYGSQVASEQPSDKVAVFFAFLRDSFLL